MARSFNGTSDAITVTGIASLATNWTVGGWFNCNNIHTNTPLWARWASTSVNRELYVYLKGSSPTGVIQIDVPFLSAIGASTTTFSNTQGWVSWVLTRSGNIWNLYINGVLDGAFPITNAVAQETSTVLDIGWSTADTNFFSGSLAETFGSTAVWSASEAAAFAQGARVPTIRGGAGLIGYWPLDGLRSPEPDLSGSANNGVLTGTAFAFGPPTTLLTPRWPQFTLVAAPVTPPNFALMPQAIL